ncbi:hypothetical protein JCM3774_005278 [Rhodotorula dairenensis]
MPAESGSSSHTSSDDQTALQELLAARGTTSWNRDDVQRVVEGFGSSGELHALALAALARALASGPTLSTTTSLLKDKLNSLLAGTDTAELVSGFRLLSALFQVAPETAASLVKDPILSSHLTDAVETISAAGCAPSKSTTKGKGKQDQAVVELVELLSLAAGQPAVRPVVDAAASPWLESLLGSPDRPSLNRRLAALAGAATIKIRLGREAAASTGLPPPHRPTSAWTSVALARRLVDLATPDPGSVPHPRSLSAAEDDVLLPVIEGLAFLTLTPSPRIKSIASEEAFLARLFTLFDVKDQAARPAATSSSHARDYALATLLDHLTAYPQLQSASDEAKQVERLKRFASAAGREDDELEYESADAVEARVLRVVGTKPSVVPLLRHLCTSASIQTRRAAARILHSLLTPQKTRGQLLQAGVARLLLSLVRHLPSPFDPSEDVPAVQGLAKLLITANPLLVFGPTPDSPLLLETMSALTLPLGVDGDAAESVSLLARFECLMALTSVASVGPSLADVLARSKLRDRPNTLVLTAIEDCLLSQNVMVRRAATELVCNLAASDAGIEHFEPPATADSSRPGSGPPSQRLHLVLALTSSPDLATRLAATGAFASLVYSPRTAVALCTFAPWRKILVDLLADEDPGVRHRVYEVWRVIGEVSAQLSDPSVREEVRTALQEEPQAVRRVEEAALAEKVDQLKEVAQAAVAALRRVD